MKNILVTGSYSVGKSSLVDELEKKIPYEKRIVTQDTARFYLRKKGLTSNNLSEQQKVELQTFVIASYVGALMQSEHSKVMGVLDGSLIEACAYSQGLPLGEALEDKMYEYLADYRNHSVAYVIPPTIPLEKDGLRHTDKEFRIAIHQKIMEIITAFNIPYHVVVQQSIENRVAEILHTHNTHYSNERTATTSRPTRIFSTGTERKNG